MNHATSALPDFFNDLRPRIAGELRTDVYSRTLYSTDASLYQVMPHGVLIPQTFDDVQAALELAAKYKVPILPRGAGSSLAGQAVNEALIIDVSRHLDQILEVNPTEGWARVQPGVIVDDLNARLKPHGLQFGPDPASSNRATLGGLTANNSTGAHSILYGMTADHILETRVLLSDGSEAQFQGISNVALAQQLKKSGLEGDVYRTIAGLIDQQADIIRAGTPKHWRRCGGYNLDRFVDGVFYHQPQEKQFNLAKLICGSEGTLAVIREIKLNLVARPKMTGLGIVHFDDQHVALRATPVILETNPSAVELLDDVGLSLCRQSPAFNALLRTFTDGEPKCLLITEYYGESEAELRHHIDRLINHLKRQSVPAKVRPAIDARLQANVWQVRKESLGLVMSMRGDRKPIPFIEDAAVPVEHLDDYIRHVEDFCRELGCEVGYYAHASAGCLHVRPHLNTKSAQDVAKMPQIGRHVAGLLKQYNGVWCSEHGDGRARSWLNAEFFGPELYGLYRQVKQAFDPHNLLNPGNIVDLRRDSIAPGDGISLTQNLRLGPGYQTMPIREHLDFRHDGGFARAVEMCNGAGVCRKLSGGVMCPSFMATRDEEHSVRGRANALRAALSGHLPHEELTSPRMYQVMDLCISCKACKNECPSAVDMAKIKLEFMGQYRLDNGASLRDRAFGHIAAISRAGQFVAPLINVGLQSGLVKKMLGVHPKRELPLLARQTFVDRLKRHKLLDKPRVDAILYVDTFTNYFEPEVGIAALEVLEAAGLSIGTISGGCCGRPLLSKGLLPEAKNVALRALKILHPLTMFGIPLIFLEPSCLSALRDDYLYLLPDDPRTKIVAANCLSFEEFVVQAMNNNTWKLPLIEDKRPILLHGHCHQKAITGMAAAKHLLAWPGHPVQEVDTSCCGMAGSFGYEAEHYDISMKMAERRLLPAVREAAPETLIVAAGTSCRHQIAHGSGKRALHPAEVLHQSLRP